MERMIFGHVLSLFETIESTGIENSTVEISKGKICRDFKTLIFVSQSTEPWETHWKNTRTKIRPTLKQQRERINRPK